MDEKSFVLPEDPRIGSLICNRYRVARLLGEGGMGAVYEGEHVRIQRRVALKFLHREHVRTPGAMTRFRREALAATAVGNPHVIEVLDMDQAEDGAPFMVLEYLEGRSLAEEIEQHGPMSLERALHIMRQLCAALDEVHQQGITHRDLKPDNLFLLQRPNDADFVKILDFGVSKFSESRDGLTVNLTKTGAAVGSIYFMAPEQARGAHDVDARADIYGLGGVFFFMLTGRPVFDGDSIPYLMMQIVSDPPPQLAIFRPELPPALSWVLSRALAKEREQRFPDCASLCQELEAASAGHLAPKGMSAQAVARATQPNLAHTAVTRPALVAQGSLGRASTEPVASTLAGAAPGTSIVDVAEQAAVPKALAPSFTDGASSHGLGSRRPLRALMLFALAGALAAAGSLFWRQLHTTEPAVEAAHPPALPRAPAATTPANEAEANMSPSAATPAARMEAPRDEKAQAPAPHPARSRVRPAAADARNSEPLAGASASEPAPAAAPAEVAPLPPNAPTPAAPSPAAKEPTNASDQRELKRVRL